MDNSIKVGTHSERSNYYALETRGNQGTCPKIGNFLHEVSQSKIVRALLISAFAVIIITLLFSPPEWIIAVVGISIFALSMLIQFALDRDEKALFPQTSTSKSPIKKVRARRKTKFSKTIPITSVVPNSASRSLSPSPQRALALPSTIPVTTIASNSVPPSPPLRSSYLCLPTPLSALEERLINAGLADKSLEQQKLVKDIFSQVLAIKRKYEGDHYIFTHGQAAQWYVVSQLIKILVGAPFSSSFDYLRSPKQKGAGRPATDYIQMMNEKSVYSDHDPKMRRFLVSSDLYVLSTRVAESAFYYFTQNCNVLSNQNRHAIREECTTILKEYLFGVPIEKIAQCAQKIYDLSLTINTLCGHLFVICIRKDFCNRDWNKVGYLAHSGGAPCDHYSNNVTAVVEDLQRGQLPKKCPDCYPQFRLLASAVTPDVAESFLVSPLTEQQKRVIFETIVQAIKEEVLPGQSANLCF